MNDAIIEINSLTKIFKNNTGIKNISFNIKKGSFHVLIGSNGAGKTTIIRSLLRIYKKYDGEVKINNVSTTNKEVYENVSYISETPLFPQEYNAHDFLLWAGRLKGINDNKVKLLIEDYAKKLGVFDILKNKPMKLSSGQKQKIMLIKVLIERAEIIIMDEPTANLDPSARIVFFDSIRELHKEGKTIFVCSHNLDEINSKASWVTVLNNGKVAYDGKKTNKKTLTEIFKENTIDEVTHD